MESNGKLQRTPIIPSVSSVLLEKHKCKFPHEFNPVNFMNEQAWLEKPEAFMSFSVGKITLSLFVHFILLS